MSAAVAHRERCPDGGPGADLGAQFYAHLYVGLYYEATGNAAGALKEITAAAQDQYSMGGYMHMVAKVHLALLQKRK